ncbi:MAG: capsular biosynthesis protein [Prevotella sp.]|nr:capsular biosynthesis protein [Prevotella sp.]
MGLFSFSKELGKIPFLKDATDFHSHILPGVDDGFPEMEKSLAALYFLEEQGLKKLWLTPHIMEDYPNETADLKQRFAELKEAYTGKIELRLAAENMLDPIFEQRLANNDLLPIGDQGNHLLVETSYFNPPVGLNEILDKINAAGYYILLAHPERYIYMNRDDYKKLKERGVKFQINYGSLVGFYGDTSRKKAEWLLREGYVDVFGSDVHRLGYVKNQLHNKISSTSSTHLLSLAQNEPQL